MLSTIPTRLAKPIFNVLKQGFYERKITAPRHHPLAAKMALAWDNLDGQSLMLVKDPPTRARAARPIAGAAPSQSAGFR